MPKKLPVLETIAFVSGFSLMVFELAAARVLAPSIGSSTYVWTSVIGVIIAALSLGYWMGGKLADWRAQRSDLAWLLIAAAATITVTLITYMSLLDWTVASFQDARAQGVVASIVLFAPTSFLIGVLSPYLVKLKITSLQTSGQSFASLSALESIGGISGTFMAGFFLFGLIGSRETFAVVVVLLLLTSWLIVPKVAWPARLGAGILILSVSLMSLQTVDSMEIDTPSSHYSIVTGMREGQPMRGLATGPNGTQSGIYINQPDKLLFWYTQQMAEVVELAEHKQNILVLGGGAFTLPQYLAEKYPDSTVDVVEIDPQLAEIARQHFNYMDPANVNLIFTDARSYVNQTKRKYDIILVDVYSDADVPFSLLTRQYGQHIKRILNTDGLVAVNMIASLDGECRDILRALDAPYRAVLGSASYTDQRPGDRSNMVVVYGNQPSMPELPDSQPLDLPPTSPYTDNYAPAEKLQQQCRSQS